MANSTSATAAGSGSRTRSGSKGGRANGTGAGNANGNGGASHGNGNRRTSPAVNGQSGKGGRGKDNGPKTAPKAIPPSASTSSTATPATTPSPTPAQAFGKALNGASRSSAPRLSNSVPSTPSQKEEHAFTGTHSRDPSPQSAYSETNAQRRFEARQPCRWETAQETSRRRIPYNAGSGLLPPVEPSTVAEALTPELEKKLNEDCENLFKQIEPTPEIEARRVKLMDKLRDMFNKEWPGHNIEVHRFGSSGNLLCTDESDLDICITTQWDGLSSVCKIAELLDTKGMQKIVCINAAKVPIVKMWDPELQLACDMNVNNTAALENTRMVRTYVQLDERVRPLTMLIKHWTKKRIINEAGTGGTLNSYTWICLVIAFLQQCSPPVLPTLHDATLPRLPRKDGTRSAFADDIEAIRAEYPSTNTSSLASLLFQFFRFYAHELDLGKTVISVRHGEIFPRAGIEPWSKVPDGHFCIEEPFNVARNLGNTADEYSVHGLHQEMRRAFELLSAANLEECCAQFEFPKLEERSTNFVPPTSRAVPVRSSGPAQQTNGQGRGRGPNNRNGGRNNFRNGGNGNRRGSGNPNGYDQNSYTAPTTPTLNSVDMWYQNFANAHLAAGASPQDTMNLIQEHRHMVAVYQQQLWQQQQQHSLQALAAQVSQPPQSQTQPATTTAAPAAALLNPMQQFQNLQNIQFIQAIQQQQAQMIQLQQQQQVHIAAAAQATAGMKTPGPANGSRPRTGSVDAMAPGFMQLYSPFYPLASGYSPVNMMMSELSLGGRQGQHAESAQSTPSTPMRVSRGRSA